MLLRGVRLLAVIAKGTEESKCLLGRKVRSQFSVKTLVKIM